MIMEKDLRKRIRIILEGINLSNSDKPVIDISEVKSSDLIKDRFLKIKFNNSTGNELNLYVPVSSFTNWYNTSKPTGNVMNKFVKEFIQSPDVNDESVINEIVDEFGDIIGDEDEPNNSTNSMVGSSKFGSDKAIRQSVAKISTYDNNLGRGMVTW